MNVSSGGHQWLLPDGTIQYGNVNYTLPVSWAGADYAYLQMIGGRTVAEITGIADAIGGLTYGHALIDAVDLAFVRTVTYLEIGYLATVFGDVSNVGESVSAATSSALRVFGAPWMLYGTLNDWPVLQNTISLSLTYNYHVSGSLRFRTDSPCSGLVFNNSTGFSYADIATTIINWNACNAGVFARTGNFNQYKRSLIGAANPAAEAAIVSLSAKGASWTFLAE